MGDREDNNRSLLLSPFNLLSLRNRSNLLRNLKRLENASNRTSKVDNSLKNASKLDLLLPLLISLITVKMPSAIAQNRYVQTLGQLCKAMALPYITKVEARQQNQNKQEYSYDFSIKIDPRGQKASMKVEGDCDQVEMKNIRIPQSFQGLLPVNVQNTDAINILQKLTNGQAPSTCSIENGKQVKTFDNVEYQLNEGQLNNCEHVIFKDCSEDSKVQVSVQQQSSSKKVKVMIDNHQYEVEIQSGGS